MILVTGYTGVIGRGVERFLSPEVEIVGLSSSSEDTTVECCDIRDLVALRKIVLHYKPTAIVHLAGVKDINRCEAEPNVCHSINVLGTKNILQLAGQVNALFVYISSDYVFDGKNGDYKENDPTNPTQIYGRTKVETKELVAQSENGIICRTAGVYGLDLYYDLYNSPTYLPGLCLGIRKLIKLQKPGIYHVCGQDSINRYEFGVAIAKFYGVDPAYLRPTVGLQIEPLRPPMCC